MTQEEKRKKRAAYMRGWYRKNADRIYREQRERYANDKKYRKYKNIKNAESYARHKMERKKSGHLYYEKNKEYIKTRVRTYVKNNSESIKKKIKEYAKKNRPIFSARARAYEISKINAVPKWVNKKEIEKIYRLAKDMTEIGGEVYHVDHIYPLRGKTFCGLHVPWNLQVIPWHINISKGNRIPQEMLHMKNP